MYLITIKINLQLSGPCSHCILYMYRKTDSGESTGSKINIQLAADTCIYYFYCCVDVRVIFQSARRNKSVFPTKIRSTVPKCQKLYIRLVVGAARISTLEKRNVDCMTEKLNILKVPQVPVMHLLSQTTSRQLVTT